MRNLRIDSRRLWASLMEMAKIGALPHGGCGRLALTDLDREGRDLFVRWCEEAGCTVAVDSLGNIFARRAGRDPSRKPVATGSHLDTQPHGGKFDGVLGVLAGLEVLRTLNDAGVETEAPIEVCVWTNEEGCRFTPSMGSSGVFGGVHRAEEVLEVRDVDGKSFGEELARIGYAGAERCGDRAFETFYELHIEQGPILEAAKAQIGVVTGVQGFRWYDVALRGQDAHAGPTPMEVRRDAMFAAARMVQLVVQAGRDRPPHGRGTVGHMRVLPNSRNTIPGEVHFTIDIRHPDAAVLDAMARDLLQAIRRSAAEDLVEIDIDEVTYSAPIAFDEGCVAAVRLAAERLGYGHMDVVSGAGHDAVNVSRVAPTSMIFIPCAEGLSHNEEERIEPDQAETGANVLLHAILERAG
jgi:N-carbamoyl-L-amino-acid hydrolase